MGNSKLIAQINCYQCLKFIGKHQMGVEEEDSPAKIYQIALVDDQDSNEKTHHVEDYDMMNVPPDEGTLIVPIEDQDFIEQRKNTEDARRYILKTPILLTLDMESLTSIGIEGCEYIQELIAEPINDDMELVLNDPDGVKVWCKYYQDEQKFWVSIMRYTFSIQGTIDKYIEFISDLKLQMKIEPAIESYERHMEDEDTCLQYLRYKKVLMIDSRDFVYVKYTERQEGRLVEVSKSVEMPNFEPIMKFKSQPQRALLLLSGNVIEESDDGFLHFSAYSECNMKLKINPSMTKMKSANEVKKFKQKMQKYLSELL